MPNAAQANYLFSVGSFECAVIADGTNMYETASILGDVPPAQAEEARRVYHLDSDHLCVDYTTLLIDTGQQRVLIDTGVGAIGDEPDPTYGRLTENLRRLSVKPQDINIVIMTHIHPDHIGGVIDAQGQPAFPNARYLLARDEWTFWLEEPDMNGVTQPKELLRRFADFAETHLRAIQEQVALVSPGVEIIPGVRAVAAPGHTPGHLALDIISRGERLLVIGDAALHPVHVEHPEWTAAVDTRAAQTLATRRILFEWATATNTLVQANHFPFPGLGHITHPSLTWMWNPI